MGYEIHSRPSKTKLFTEGHRMEQLSILWTKTDFQHIISVAQLGEIFTENVELVNQ